MNRFVLVSIGLSVVVACRGGGSGGNGDDAPADAQIDAPNLLVKIQDIQNEAMPAGTDVELRGVVVTAIDSYGARTGDLWVQEPGGGEFSGIKVFRAPLSQIATLVPGDIVTITGAEKAEFALNEETTPRRLTELVGANRGMMTVTKTGTGTVPAPSVVDAVAISMLTPDEQNAEWEKWEGVLITVTNPRQLSPVATFGDGAIDQRDFDATGGIAVQTVLGDFPTNVRMNTCYTSITGIGEYFFQYLLLPRGPDDLVPGGDACAPSTIVTTNIADVQAGRTTGVVELKDVFVSAISSNKKNLWLTTALDAAANEGLFIFRGNGAAELASDVVVGAKLEVIGTVVDFNNDQVGDSLTQLNNTEIVVKEAPTTAPVPVSGQLASALVDATTGEPFESVLVSLAGVKVNTVGTASPFTGELQQGDTKFLSDDDILRLVAADVDKCFDLVGIWTYQVFANVYGLLPITKTEVTCPAPEPDPEPNPVRAPAARRAAR